MIRARAMLLVIAALPSCGHDATTGTPVHEGPPVTITIEELRTEAARLLGRRVRFTGLCVRVSDHGSSEAYLVGEDPSFEVRVAIGDQAVKLSRYAEGRVLEVEGIVRDANWRHTYPGPSYFIDCDRYRRAAARAPSTSTGRAR